MSTYVQDKMAEIELRRAEDKLFALQTQTIEEKIMTAVSNVAASVTRLYWRFDSAAIKTIEKNAVPYLLGFLSAFILLCFIA